MAAGGKDDDETDVIENDFDNAEAAEILEDARTAIKKTVKKKKATKEVIKKVKK